jgi:hypothetical protein
MRSAAGNILAGALLLFSTAATAAGTNAGYEMGGQYARFDPVVSQYNQSGELFRIEGHCQSSCTLFLAIRNVCIGRGATLLFHAAHDRDQNPSPSRTEHMLGAYMQACATTSRRTISWTRSNSTQSPAAR